MATTLLASLESSKMIFVTKKTKPSKGSDTSRHPHALRYSLLAIGLWCVSVFASVNLLAPQQLYAQSHQNIAARAVSDPAGRAVTIAKPATVRLWTDVLGHLTVQFPPTTSVSFPQQTNGNYRLSSIGTGIFISSQGDVLTADHVVHPPDQVLNPKLYAAAAQDVANYINHNAKAGSAQVTAKDVLQQLTSGTLQSSAVYASPTIRVYLSTDYAGPYAAPDLQSLPSTSVMTVDAIKAHSPFDQKDEAIVHVPTTTDTASVAVNGDAMLKPQAFLTSSPTSVVVSSIKSSESGPPLIQIGNSINDGNDGSPALNSQGEIVGTESFVLPNSPGVSFLQASKSALQLAQSINLDLTPGPFQKLWSQAYNDYAATTPGHWHKAEQEFTHLARSYPQFQAVQPLLTEARTQAEAEPTPFVSPTPTQGQHVSQGSNSSSSVAHPFSLAPWQAWAIMIGGVVLLLMLAICLTMLMRKRNVHPPKKEDSKNVSGITASTSSLLTTSQSPDSGGTGQTLSLKAWPCGHMNRPGASFCKVCRERAPET
ncbi:MAG: trypsin-like peptidase domain-containing protein [Chloroflexi bacterium]|nr:MAG: trypsin-like peptidase domain-containing protein [Chloroflexota bacterium]